MYVHIRWLDDEYVLQCVSKVRLIVGHLLPIDVLRLVHVFCYVIDSINSVDSIIFCVRHVRWEQSKIHAM